MPKKSKKINIDQKKSENVWKASSVGTMLILSFFFLYRFRNILLKWRNAFV